MYTHAIALVLFVLSGIACVVNFRHATIAEKPILFAIGGLLSLATMAWIFWFLAVLIPTSPVLPTGRELSAEELCRLPERCGCELTDGDRIFTSPCFSFEEDLADFMDSNDGKITCNGSYSVVWKPPACPQTLQQTSSAS